MENDQQKHPAGQGQSGHGEKNPTLEEPGAQVADYGNVTGGSASTVEQEQQPRGGEQSASRSGEGDTLGQP